MKTLAYAKKAIWYHGREVNSDLFDLIHVGTRGSNQEGVGFYFTNCKNDAIRYTENNGVVLTVKLHPRKLVSINRPANLNHVLLLINAAPDLEFSLSDWGENLNSAKRKALERMVGENAKDTFENVWWHFYKNDSALFLKNMVSLGYDGHFAEADNQATHIIIYNTKIIEVLEKESF